MRTYHPPSKDSVIINVESCFSDLVLREEGGLNRIPPADLIQKFMKLATASEQFGFAKKWFDRETDEVAHGGSRMVWKLTDKLVLKLAMVNFGKEQNETEWKNSRMFPVLVPKIVRHATDWSWLIIERCVPFESDENMINMLGFGESDIYHLFSAAADISSINPNMLWKRIQTTLKWDKPNVRDHWSLEFLQKMLSFPAIKTAVEAINQKKISSNEPKYSEHWGLTVTNGKLVLLDVGI